MKKGCYIIYGTGPQANICFDYFIEQNSDAFVIFLDDNKSTDFFLGREVYSSFNEVFKLKFDSFYFHVAIGNPIIKKEIVKKIDQNKCYYFSIIHPSAIISNYAKLGEGIFVGMHVSINTNTRIGSHVIINTGVIIEHDSEVHDNVNLSPGVIVGGRCKIFEGAFIGSNSTLRARSNIGKNSIIGMNSMVLKDIPENFLAYGTPAVPKKEINSNFNWKNVL